MTVVRSDVVKEVSINMIVFCNVTPYGLVVDGIGVSKGFSASVFYREAGGNSFFWNVGVILSNFKASHTRSCHTVDSSHVSVPAFWPVTSPTAIQSVAVLWSGKALCYAFMTYSAQMPNSFVRQSTCLYVGPYNVMYSSGLVFSCVTLDLSARRHIFVARVCICPNRRREVVEPLFCKCLTVQFLLILFFPCSFKDRLWAEMSVSDHFCCFEVSETFFSFSVCVVFYSKRMSLFYFVSFYRFRTSRLTWAQPS